MNFTKSQKDALVRKVQSILNKKADEERNRLEKEWKPNKEQKEFIKRLARVWQALLEYRKVVAEEGFSFQYGQICYPLDGKIEGFYHNSDEPYDSYYITQEKSAYANKNFDNDKFGYSTEKIYDDLELMILSKDFDVDAFLKKYEEL